MNLKTALLIALSGVAGSSYASSNPADWFNGTWIAPLESSIPNDASGDSIRYGKLLLTETYKYLGQGSTMPFTNNKISCSNCHLDEGTSAFGTPWAVVAQKYASAPYSPRSDRKLNMVNRIQDCVLRSMNGVQLPPTSYEMTSMIAYMNWLSTGIQVASYTAVVGQGNMKVNDLTRPADPVAGKVIYDNNCAACHQSDGSGVWDTVAVRYVYPAVWGPNSYNTGAGMHRLRTGVGFARGNMPYGHANPTDVPSMITEAQAWDVMAYISSQPRPEYYNYLNDWAGFRPSDCMPNWLLKQPDASYANYFPRVETDGRLSGNLSYPQMFSDDQHHYGPWQAMLTLQTAMQNAYLAITPRPVYPSCSEFVYDPVTKTGVLR